ncbi:hypothetical protein FA13DRAFT_1712743 [Coprinellus micaceus]|uniref:Uncharacterized protein n=1 Tax=Coprinellus micaceus TaxID=71717 RepID=A0A4Y7T0X4_COPMI|nr:hypothetical protein FA13DRAFT_1712743 [Coprinellus micaceus]
MRTCDFVPHFPADAFALGREVPNHRLFPDWEGDDGSAMSRTLGEHDGRIRVYFGDPLRGLYPRQRVSVVPLPGLWNIRPLVCFTDTATFGVPMRKPYGKPDDDAMLLSTPRGTVFLVWAGLPHMEHKVVPSPGNFRWDPRQGQTSHGLLDVEHTWRREEPGIEGARRPKAFFVDLLDSTNATRRIAALSQTLCIAIHKNGVYLRNEKSNTPRNRDRITVEPISHLLRTYERDLPISSTGSSPGEGLTGVDFQKSLISFQRHLRGPDTVNIHDSKRHHMEAGHDPSQLPSKSLLTPSPCREMLRGKRKAWKPEGDRRLCVHAARQNGPGALFESATNSVVLRMQRRAEVELVPYLPFILKRERNLRIRPANVPAVCKHQNAAFIGLEPLAESFVSIQRPNNPSFEMAGEPRKKGIATQKPIITVYYDDE